MEDELHEKGLIPSCVRAFSSRLGDTAKSSSASILSSNIETHDDPKPVLAQPPGPPRPPTAPHISDSSVLLAKTHPDFIPTSISHHQLTANLQGQCDSAYSSSPSSINLAQAAGWDSVDHHHIPIDSPSPSSSSSSSSSSLVYSKRAHTNTSQWMNPISTRTRSSTMSQSELPCYHVGESPPRANHDQSQILHPIIKLFQEQELGRHILVVSVPMTTGLLTLYSSNSESLLVRLTVLALISIGFVATWNGIFLRTSTFHRTANAIEQLGVSFVFLAFFVLVGSFLPVNFVWVPVLCCFLSLLPFAFAFFSIGVPETDRGLTQRQGHDNTSGPPHRVSSC